MVGFVDASASAGPRAWLQVFVLTVVTSAAVVCALAGCAWHRRRMQRRREGGSLDG